MKLLTTNQVIDLIQPHKGLNNDYIRQLSTESVQYFEFTIESQQFFESLIWHYVGMTQILTPGTWYGGGKLYTVGTVAHRFIELGLSFYGLVSGKESGTYQPEWFKPCLDMEKTFDPEKLGPFMVHMSHPNELKDCPNSPFRLIDGIHRSLVYTVKLKKNTIDFRPVKVILAIK